MSYETHDLRLETRSICDSRPWVILKVAFRINNYGVQDHVDERLQQTSSLLVLMRPHIAKPRAYLVQSDPVLDSISEPGKQEVRIRDEIIYDIRLVLATESAVSFL